MNNQSILARIPKRLLTPYEQHYILFYSPVLERFLIPYIAEVQDHE